MADHFYGSDGTTDIKLDVLRRYLAAYTKALSRQDFDLWYIDGFAGTGTRAIEVPGRDRDLWSEGEAARIERRRGSAQIALETRPPFHRLIFIEKNPAYCTALEELTARDPNPERVTIWPGDANTKIISQCNTTIWSGIRAVMFLDPYGMEVEWRTLAAIAATGAIDLWYLFSVEGLYRQAARSMDKIDPIKEAAITRMLGTDEWKEAFYAEPKRPAQPSLFGDDQSGPLQRAAGIAELEAYVKQRIKSIFASVLDPMPLPINRRPQKFSLFFAVSNREPKAYGLANKIADHILTAGISSQRRPR